MHLIHHETSRAIRLLRAESRDGHREHGPAIARAFEARYEFMQGPRTVQEYDLTRGATFWAGRFKDVAIDRFQLFNNGLLAEGKADTDMLDAFLEDVLEWGRTERGLEYHSNENAASIQKAYFSQQVVECAPAIGDALAKMSALPQQIVRMMTSYGMPDSPAQVAGVLVVPDPASGNNWAYRFERSLGDAFNSNRFFASGPLRTKDSLSLIEGLEAEVTVYSSVQPPPS